MFTSGYANMEKSFYCLNSTVYESHLVDLKYQAIDKSAFLPSYSTVYVNVFLAPVVGKRHKTVKTENL